MDLDRLDHLARSLATASSRRRLLGGLGVAATLGGLLEILAPEETEAKDRRRRRKQRHNKRKDPGGRKGKGCKPASRATVCAERCGPVTNRQTCGRTVDCGSCDCSPACDECFTCQGNAGAPGSCVPQQAGTPCGAAAACDNGTLQPQASCDGSGVCALADPISCAPYLLCDGDACATSCADDSECVGESFCNGGKCVGDLLDGESCANADQCASGFCVDGVCCNMACNAACRACNIAGSIGTCTSEANGTSCGGGNICCAGSCQECCNSDQCTSPSEPVCVGGQCTTCSASPTDCPSNTCCNASSGTCDATCPASAPICVTDVCMVCSVAHPCPGGCCAANGSCYAGNTDPACGAVGGVCDVCEATETCTSGTCVGLPCGQGGVCRVFVTSTPSQANLGGLAGADAICQGLAQAAGLPGSYKAWLSDDTGSPSTRFVQPTGPYRRVDNVTVANAWSDLTDGVLLAPINVTDTGEAVTSTDLSRFVWTNTATNGFSLGSQDCDNWASNQPGIGGGAIGISLATDSRWTVTGSSDCDFIRRLYCFQQSI